MNDFWSKLNDRVYIIAEIGANHLGDLESARLMIGAAAEAGCDAVKFQKRTPYLAVPREQKFVPYNTPWGEMSYLQYREKVEFGFQEYEEIDRYAKSVDIQWSASVWDQPSVDFMEYFRPPWYKIPSASLTDHELLRYVAARDRPVILSTGMSTMLQIYEAFNQLDPKQTIIAHCTSTYPCPPDNLNLQMIPNLEENFYDKTEGGVPIGYSGHEAGTVPTLAAVALGAQVVERHITLDKELWGSDQAFALEPKELKRLVRDIRLVERAMGDGEKQVYPDELSAMKKLRRVHAAQPVA